MIGRETLPQVTGESGSTRESKKGLFVGGAKEVHASKNHFGGT